MQRREFLSLAAAGSGSAALMASAQQAASPSSAPVPLLAADSVLRHIAFGSCANQKLPQPIWDAVLANRPDLYIFAGDNVYASAQLAAVAVALASIGLYGVLAYSVARRARELGIRMALGADRGHVRGMVLGEGLAIAAVGVALGTAGALTMVRLIESLLYEVPPRDVVTFTVTAAGLLGVAALASLLPARRATRVNPLVVLRYE